MKKKRKVEVVMNLEEDGDGGGDRW